MVIQLGLFPAFLHRSAMLACGLSFPEFVRQHRRHFQVAVSASRRCLHFSMTMEYPGRHRVLAACFESLLLKW